MARTIIIEMDNKAKYSSMEIVSVAPIVIHALEVMPKINLPPHLQQ